MCVWVYIHIYTYPSRDSRKAIGYAMFWIESLESWRLKKKMPTADTKNENIIYMQRDSTRLDMRYIFVIHIRCWHATRLDTPVHAHTCVWRKYCLCMSMTESCQMYDWVVSDEWLMYEWCMTDVKCMNESCLMYGWCMANVWLTDVKCMNDSWWSCPMYGWVMPHVWMSHVTHMNESCHTYERVMPHVWMGPVPHMNESCHLRDTRPWLPLWHCCRVEKLHRCCGLRRIHRTWHATGRSLDWAHIPVYVYIYIYIYIYIHIYIYIYIYLYIYMYTYIYT